MDQNELHSHRIDKIAGQSTPANAIQRVFCRIDPAFGIGRRGTWSVQEEKRRQVNRIREIQPPIVIGIEGVLAKRPFIKSLLEEFAGDKKHVGQIDDPISVCISSNETCFSLLNLALKLCAQAYQGSRRYLQQTAFPLAQSGATRAPRRNNPQR
jgi:hypothetical protein